MRQPELDKILPSTAGRSSERPVSFPDVLLYRGRAADGAACLVTFDRRTVVVARPVGALPCRIRLSARQYLAVAVVAADEGHTIRLVHGDDGLTIDLVEVEGLEAAEEYCDRLARFLDLPTLLLGGKGAEPEAGSAPAPRRNSGIRARRARFLTSRKTGEVVAMKRIAGREIIARS